MVKECLIYYIYFCAFGRLYYFIKSQMKTHTHKKKTKTVCNSAAISDKYFSCCFLCFIYLFLFFIILLYKKTWILQEYMWQEKNNPSPGTL